MSKPVEWPPSLWAAVSPAGPPLPAVDGDVNADVAVIGAGFTGLSTALSLARAGVDVGVIEAAELGWGPPAATMGRLSRPSRGRSRTTSSGGTGRPASASCT